eukprot:763464-Hanusia_phi.AAC.1
MLDAIDEFNDEVSKNDDACLFAFVGHAVELSDQHFLIPSRPTLKSFTCAPGEEQAMVKKLTHSCLSFAEIQEEVNKSRKDSKHLSLFVLDCCRNSCVTRGLLKAPSSIAMNFYIVYSTTSGKGAYDGEDNKGGPFMTSLVDEMLVSPKQELDVVVRQTTARVLEKTSNCTVRYHAALRHSSFEDIELLGFDFTGFSTSVTFLSISSGSASTASRPGKASLGPGQYGQLCRLIRTELPCHGPSHLYLC